VADTDAVVVIEVKPPAPSFPGAATSASRKQLPPLVLIPRQAAGGFWLVAQVRDGRRRGKGGGGGEGAAACGSVCAVAGA